MAASSLMPDRDGAVREVAQVYELIKTHQPLLLVHADEQSLSTTTLLAQNLLSKALRALHVALSFMRQQQPAAVPASIKAEPQVLPSSSPASSNGDPAADCKQASMMRRAGKRKRTEDKYSWVNMTAVPHEDGYQWRKYGEKKIHGTHFTRSYFRCTYKDDKGCQARKQVQQKDNKDPPMFQVTYNNEHTCGICTTRAATSSNNLDLLEYDFNTAGISYPNGPADHASRTIKQEPQATLTPPAAEVVSDVTPCQEAFPINDNRCGVSQNDIGIPSTASATNISAVSCDELERHMGQTTTTTVMDHEPAPGDQLGDDTFLYDPHLLLLYDSFNYY